MTSDEMNDLILTDGNMATDQVNSYLKQGYSFENIKELEDETKAM